MHPFEDRESLTETCPKLFNDPVRPRSSTVNYATYLSEDNIQALYIGRLWELHPGASNVWNRPFWEGKSIIHIDDVKPWQSRGIELWGDLNETHDYTWESPLVTFIAVVLTGIYGGVHMVAWGWSFPSHPEEIMWKLSWFLIILTVPALILIYFLIELLKKADENLMIWRVLNSVPWFRFGLQYNPFALLHKPLALLYKPLALLVLSLLALGYLFARVFIIVKSFISLRRAAVGIFVSPEWVELFPQF